LVDMRVVVEVCVAQVGSRPRSASALPQQQKVALNASLSAVIGNMDRGRALRVCVKKHSEAQSTQSSKRLLSGVHSIMRVKLAHAGEGGGCTPAPFHYIYHHQ
jgi:hypothetical protein